MFIGYIHYKWSFSIAMLIYQRVLLDIKDIKAETDAMTGSMESNRTEMDTKCDKILI